MATYTVQPGDTLGEIARQFGTTVADLQRLNNISDLNVIRVGISLMIPDNGSVAAGDYSVGGGVLAAMRQDGTTPASDEVYVHGNRSDAQWSDTMGRNGTLYRWVSATGQVHRFSPR